MGQKVKSAEQPLKGTTKETGNLGKAQDKTAKSADGIAGKFQKNKGIIFGVTMLSSGIIEAIGMYSMWDDANKKVSSSQKALDDVVAGGLKGTESYQKQLLKVSEAQARLNELRAKAKPNLLAIQKAENKLAAEQKKLNEMVDGGVKGTKEYQDASDNLADAQKGLRFVQ